MYLVGKLPDDGRVFRQFHLTLATRSQQTICNGTHAACLHSQWNQQRSNSDPRSMDPTRPQPCSILQFRTPGDSSDRLLAHYFQSEAVQDMEGYFSPEFWADIVLPLSHDDTCVRYSTSALSAFHKEHIVSPKDGSTRKFTSKASFDYQYYRATQVLRGYMTSNIRPSNKLILVCCLIFFCIELSREQFQNAEKRAYKTFLVFSDLAPSCFF